MYETCISDLDILLIYTGIKERGQPATSPIVEEINLGHIESGWSIRVRNRMGITCEDVLFAM